MTANIISKAFGAPGWNRGVLDRLADSGRHRQSRRFHGGGFLTGTGWELANP